MTSRRTGPIRLAWIQERGDVEVVEPTYKPEAGVELPQRRAVLKGRSSVTQMTYARHGIITPEMEFIAIRENLNHANSETFHEGQSWGATIPRVITPEFVRKRWRAAGRSSPPTSITRKASQ